MSTDGNSGADPSADESREKDQPAIDKMTILKTFYSDQILTKAIRQDNAVKSYSKAKFFVLRSTAISSLDEIGRMLQQLMYEPRCCVVYGGIADPQRVNGVRRLSSPAEDKKTGEIYQPTLKPVTHFWASLDIDGGPIPVGAPMTDLEACAAAAIARLPAAFHGVRYIVQATSGHGRKKGGTYLRLWFWLSRATSGDELGFWLKKHVDPCVFRACQHIFTANPVFLSGVDILPYRIKGVNGAPYVQVPDPQDLKPKPRPPAPPYVPGKPVAPEDYQAIIDGALARVAAAKDGEKHARLRSESTLLGGIQRQAQLADAEIIQWLLDALPDTVKDWDQAESTIRWGLDAGRAKPFHPESKAARKALTQTIFRLLRSGAPGADLKNEVIRQNEEFPNPLAPESLVELVGWAIGQEVSGGFHAE